MLGRAEEPRITFGVDVGVLGVLKRHGDSRGPQDQSLRIGELTDSIPGMPGADWGAHKVVWECCNR